VQFFFNRIKEKDGNRRINAFVRLTETKALEQAKECEDLLKGYNWDEIKETKPVWKEILAKKPLFGIPYAIKDIILIEGEIFTAASDILEGYRAPYSSTVYNKVTASGAIVIGINNMDQFAKGSSGESSAHDETLNPFDLNRTPGGSSSGGAACVGAGLVVFSLGTDTGGSIRQPAAFCNVVGMKPTYGAVSRYGVIPMASSLDQVGPMSNTVLDNLDRMTKIKLQ
jgi:aspartyl-tRNA(Asn)/glutamyl-tRNA(Gln) amidotransferase subunit A